MTPREKFELTQKLGLALNLIRDAQSKLYIWQTYASRKLMRASELLVRAGKELE